MTDFESAIRDRMGGVSPQEREVFDSAGRIAQGSTRISSGLRGSTERELNDLGYNLISGDTDATRAVYRSEDLVVKFEPMGTWRNENEIENWTTALPGEAKHLFAPVVDHSPDATWLVMKYADVKAVTDDQHRELLQELIVENNLDMTDPHPDNVGLLDGRAVLIDYNFRPKPAGETDAEREEFYRSKLRDYGIEP